MKKLFPKKIVQKSNPSLNSVVGHHPEQQVSNGATTGHTLDRIVNAKEEV